MNAAPGAAIIGRMHKPNHTLLPISLRLCHVVATALLTTQLVACGTANANVAPHRDPAGQKFQNNYAPADKSLPDVARWLFNRTLHGLPPKPAHPTPQLAPDLVFIQANAVAGAQMVPAVTWIGHASTLVQASGLNVLTDPVFADRASPFQWFGPKRVQPPGLILAQLPKIDVVLISHNHFDHLDPQSLLLLSQQAGGPPLFIVPLGLKGWLEARGVGPVQELDWWRSTTVGGVEFMLTPAQHWSGRGIADRRETLWGSWAVLGNDFQWYFSGDSGYSHDFLDIKARLADRQTPEKGGSFDLALLAIGAYEPRWFMQPQHINPAEAVQVHQDLGAKRSIGVHWGTFNLSDETLDQPPIDLAIARDAAKLKADEFSVMAIGETRRFARRTVP
jgi:N-acyl-phosphatidylethanolamine-hydrolysing phospholipase D